MKLIHILGMQNSGKTTLIAELIKELKDNHLNVGTIKHSTHDHELDKKGKDTYIHRQAGAIPAAIICKNLTGIFIPSQPHVDPLKKILPLYSDTDIVIIEGYMDGPGKKVEVWRKETNEKPKAFGREDIEAIITDEMIDTHIPLWPRNDISKIAENVCALMGISLQGLKIP